MGSAASMRALTDSLEQALAEPATLLAVAFLASKAGAGSSDSVGYPFEVDLGNGATSGDLMGDGMIVEQVNREAGCHNSVVLTRKPLEHSLAAVR